MPGFKYWRNSVDSCDPLTQFVRSQPVGTAFKQTFDECLQGRLRKNELLFHIHERWLLFTQDPGDESMESRRWNEVLQHENDSRSEMKLPGVRCEACMSFSLTQESAEETFAAVRRALTGVSVPTTASTPERRKPLSVRSSRKDPVHRGFAAKDGRMQTDGQTDRVRQ